MTRRSTPPNIALAMALLLGGCWALPAQAGPWSRSPGALYVKAGESFFLADTYVDASGTVREGTEYLGASTFTYFEFGVGPRLQVVGYVPFTVAQNTFPDGTKYLQTGGADAVIGLQWSPPLPITSAIRVDVKIPMYDVGGVSGAYATRFPAFGDGQVDVTGWLSVGGSIPKTPMWMWAEAGYRFRTEGYIGEGDTREFLDSFVFAGQVGAMIADRAFVGFTVSGVTPFKEDAFTKAYLALGPSGGVFLGKGFAVEASFDPIVWARNSSRGIGFGFGLSYKR
jgi:hypothetical protein